MAEVTSKSSILISPQLNSSLVVVKYTKVNATDTVTVSFPVKAVIASVDATGAVDPATFSGSVITLSTGTGAGTAIVVTA
mgnify:CR=1 FL=1